MIELVESGIATFIKFIGGGSEQWISPEILNDDEELEYDRLPNQSKRDYLIQSLMNIYCRIVKLVIEYPADQFPGFLGG